MLVLIGIILIGSALFAMQGRKGNVKYEPESSMEKDKAGTIEGEVVSDQAPDPESKPDSEFGKKVILQKGTIVVLSDGLKVSLKDINDSRCKPDVECIWAGELSATLYAYDGKFDSRQEIHLGTVKNKTITIGGYVFTLLDASTESVTIKVDNAAIQ